MLHHQLFTRSYSARLSLGIALILTSFAAIAATPAEGTLSLETPELSFESGPNSISNPSATAALVCQNPALPCDEFSLSISLPADFSSQFPNAVIHISTSWENATDDYDIALVDDAGADVNSSAGSENPEVMQQAPNGGDEHFLVRIIPFAVTGSIATTTIRLEPGEAGSGDPDQPDAPAAVIDPEAARYSLYVSPPEMGNDAGEPTLGYNPATKRSMFISYVNALRVTYPENTEPALPESCAATWENKSGTVTTLNSLDPILTTDQSTGRTFNSQLAGANSLFEFSDDDGESWMVGQVGLPNGGADHQGVVAGPYPESFPLGGILYPNAVYYCSQSVATAFCARSDDGGQTFGPGTPFKNTDCSAGALHGHPKIAPDGTLYIPDSTQCVAGLGENAEKVVAFVSEDAGLTYSVKPLPESQGGAGSDPSIGIATDGTAYMCYENADGTTRVAVSKDRGDSWENDTDVGLAAGLVATRFPAMIAGDPDRAACAFLGTTTKGADLELGFKGVWYPYISTTYDGGQTWHLTNLSPNDPVQGHGGIGTSGTNRNLLDFNDLELDDLGRPLFGYADGCTSGCVLDPSQNSFASKGTIARQSGGRTLFAEFDGLANSQFSQTPLAPAPACPNAELSRRNVVQTIVGWRAPDNGGSEISNYEVYRASDAAGPYELIGESGPKTQFVDRTADSSVATYYYKVVAENAQGASGDSNVLPLPISDVSEVDTCTLPGDPIIIDDPGDTPVSDYDILSVSVAEPLEYTGNLVITMKLAGFSATQPPPSSFYPILFPLLNNSYIAFDVSQAVPSFVHGHFEELPQGLLAFTADGDLDERSSFGADGTVVFVAPKTLFGDLQAGSVLAGFDVRSRAGASAATSRDTAGPANYIVRGDEICNATEGGVLATLSGSAARGPAPLRVDYNISGQSDDDSVLNTWSLDFGDGQFVQNQPFSESQSAMITHIYQEQGTFRATATVKDSQGRVSQNLAEHTVVVGAVDEGDDGNNGGDGIGQPPAARGGALGWLLILLSLPVLVMRRRQ